MQITPLPLPGAWLISPVQHADERGSFQESFHCERLLEATGRRFAVAQVNTSVSRGGTVRGIHFADVPPGQAKYVTCASGRIRDVIVDIRVGSPTFGQWTHVDLDDHRRQAVLLAEGLGHGFAALSPEATVTYLLNQPYRPGSEHGVDPMDAALEIDWGLAGTPVVLSERDAAAPSLAEARASGLLPSWDACQSAGYV